MLYGEVLAGDVLCSGAHITAPATYLVLENRRRHVDSKMNLKVLDLHTGQIKRLVKSRLLPITSWDVVRAEEGA